MYITSRLVKIEKFDLENSKDIADLEILLSRPDIVILSRKRAKLVNEEFEGDVATKDERIIEHVEYEECSI